MSRPNLRLLWCAVPLVLPMLTAAAQESGTEADRLRDALRHVTADLRAAQDSQTALQAALDQAQKQRDLLQQQVTQLSAQLAAHPATPAAPAAESQDNAKQLQDVVDALKKQNAALQDGLTHWQSAYQEAATLARAKDAEDRQAAAIAFTAQRTLNACEAKNTKLIATAQDILHLYETPKFRSLAADRWDLLGFKRVELQNIVQDTEDDILAQTYRHGEQSAPLPQAAPAKPPVGKAP